MNTGPALVIDSQTIGVVFMSGGITYDGHISMLGITELELGSSENSYSRHALANGQS